MSRGVQYSLEDFLSIDNAQLLGELTDLTPSGRGEWNYRKFRGTAWHHVHSAQERAHAKNRYRVLLTRARLGMLIWIPPGEAEDPTLDPAKFDLVRQVLEAAGVPELRQELGGALA
jgi:hypothetical protein